MPNRLTRRVALNEAYRKMHENSKDATANPSDPQTQPDETSRSAYAQQVQGRVFVTGEIETHLSPSDAKQKVASNAKKETRENGKYLIEKLTFITVLFYGFVTGVQAYYSYRAVHLSRDQFISDERPYVWIKPQFPTVEVGKPLNWEIDFTNYGKTPALDVHSCVLITWGTSAPSHITDPLPDLDGDVCKLSVSSSLIMPPGGVMYTIPQPGPALQDSQLKIMNSMDHNLVARGNMTYTDTGGRIYQSAFCVARNAIGAIESCGDSSVNFIRDYSK